MTAELRVGSRVLLPCYWCDAPPDVCPHARGYGEVEHIGRVLVTVKLETPPFKWQERGLSDRTKYSRSRLRVLS